MIRGKLELHVGNISDSLFHLVMQCTKDDIIFNKISFKKKTKIEELVSRAISVYATIERAQRLQKV